MRYLKPFKNDAQSLQQKPQAPKSFDSFFDGATTLSEMATSSAPQYLPDSHISNVTSGIFDRSGVHLLVAVAHHAA